MRILRPAALSLLLVGLIAPPSHGGPPARSARSTPELIERAVAEGRLDRVEADVYLIEALHGGDIPDRYEGGAPWDGTFVQLEVERRLDAMPPGPDRRALRAAVETEEEEGVRQCAGSHVGTNSFTSTHFVIDYTTIEGAGMSINAYAASLDAAWDAQIGSLGWAAPPPPPAPAPDGKYHVVVSETLGPTTYGQTASSGTHAGSVGNNPNTPWDDQDADATCIVLADNFDLPFPGTPQQALDATTAHELNHALQFGYGALDGSNVPDPAFYEGGATWMEDEVFDGSNDSYHYLWPNQADDMGSYQSSPYPYWIVFRAITERYGTAVSGGGERIMQRFWELTSKNEADTLEALDRALDPEGESLAGAFVRAASAMRFSRSCGGGYAYPFCLEEGGPYVAEEGMPPAQGSIGGIGSSFPGSLPDNYSAAFVDMPVGIGTVQVVLENAANRAGLFTGNVVCDTGAGMRVEPFSGSARSGDEIYARSVGTDGCAGVSIVVANVAQTSDNPSSSSGRPYRLSVTPTAKASRTKVRARPDDGDVRVRGRVRPAHSGDTVEVEVFKRRKGKWKRTHSEDLELKGKRFKEMLPAPNAKRCRVQATFPGDDDHLPSSARRRFAC